MKILLTGQSGQIGNELALSLHGKAEIVSFSRARMNLADLDQVLSAARDLPVAAEEGQRPPGSYERAWRPPQPAALVLAT